MFWTLEIPFETGFTVPPFPLLSHYSPLSVREEERQRQVYGKVGCCRLAARFIEVVPPFQCTLQLPSSGSFSRTYPEDMPRNAGTISVVDTYKPQKPKLFIKRRPRKQGR
jgi:hypothetical protein